MLDLTHFQVLNQETTWITRDTDFLAKFQEFAKTDPDQYSLAKDQIADLTEGSKFVNLLRSSKDQEALGDLLPVVSITIYSPSFDDVRKRIFGSGSSYHEVADAVKAESMKDPIAGYAYSIINA